jgi:hypothetical protein
MGGLEVQLETGIRSDPNLQHTAFIVQYLPSYYGVTQDGGNNPTDYKQTQASYGMWGVPPDIGSRVMCIFVEGDALQGYWFGCIQSKWQNHMIPGIAASQDVAWGKTDLKSDFTGKNYPHAVPVAEFLKETSSKKVFTPNRQPKPVHPFAYKLRIQGLIADTIRGTTTSSARRELPSSVFGISTPGRIYSEGRKARIGYETQIDIPITRQGGHTFVMDDGDVNGDNHLVRLRSSSGHQLLFHDQKGLIYLANAQGSVWIELTSQGKIDIFAKDSISIHTRGDFNFAADRDINLEAKGTIRMKAGADVISNIGGDVDTQVGGSTRTSIDGFSETFARGQYNITSSGNMNLYSLSELVMASDKKFSLQVYLDGTIHFDAASINTNGVPGTQITGAAEAIKNTKKLPVVKAPLTDETLGWPGIEYQSTLPYITFLQRVPMHEPWTQHERIGNESFALTNTDVDAPFITSGTTNNTTSVAPANPYTPLNQISAMNPATPENWTQDTEFIKAVKKLALDINADYIDLLSVMMFETANTMDPSKVTTASGSHATGLIQFVTKTAKNYGTTVTQLATMTRVQQMVYVEKYFKDKANMPYFGDPTPLDDIYMSVFCPRAYGKPLNFVCYSLAESPSSYTANKYLDKLDKVDPATGNLVRDGLITKAEAVAKLPTAKARVKAALAAAHK